jgi:hypothetical protein
LVTLATKQSSDSPTAGWKLNSRKILSCPIAHGCSNAPFLGEGEREKILGLLINLVNERGGHRLTGTPSAGEWWDVNGDGLKTALDAPIVIHWLNKCSTCDVNEDGRVSPLDALLIWNHVIAREEMGIISASIDTETDSLTAAFNDGLAYAGFHDAALMQRLTLETENAVEDYPFELLLDDVVDLLALAG